MIELLKDVIGEDAFAERFEMYEVRCEAQVLEYRSKCPRWSEYPSISAAKRPKDVSLPQLDVQPSLLKMETTLTAIMSQLRGPKRGGDSSNCRARVDESSLFYQQHKENRNALRDCMSHFRKAIPRQADMFQYCNNYFSQARQSNAYCTDTAEAQAFLRYTGSNTCFFSVGLILAKEELVAVRTALLADLFPEVRSSL